MKFIFETVPGLKLIVSQGAGLAQVSGLDGVQSQCIEPSLMVPELVLRSLMRLRRDRRVNVSTDRMLLKMAWPSWIEEFHQVVPSVLTETSKYNP